ncbi:cysteine-rich CWC family protein [Kaarinaea lacus]
MTDFKHETKRCPRCRSAFECKSGSILLCQCQSITLSEQELDFISAGYDDCLCQSCLVELRREFNQRVFREKLEKYFP